MDEFEAQGAVNEASEDAIAEGPEAEADLNVVIAEEVPAAEVERVAAIARLREALLASEPAINPALVGGDSLEALEASFASAQAAVSRIREMLRAEMAAAIPAGNTDRRTSIPATRLEKIRCGPCRALDMVLAHERVHLLGWGSGRSRRGRLTAVVFRHRDTMAGHEADEDADSHEPRGKQRTEDDDVEGQVYHLLLAFHHAHMAAPAFVPEFLEAVFLRLLFDRAAWQNLHRTVVPSIVLRE